MTELSIKLLKRQREIGFTGFTIPFLIGANRNPIGRRETDEQKNYSEFIDLLNYFREADQNIVGIAKCVDLHEPVVAIYDTQKLAEDYGLRKIEEGSLFASSFYQKGQKMDSLIDQLWRCTREPILQGKFSFQGGEYLEFTTQDVNLIKSLSNA